MSKQSVYRFTGFTSKWRCWIVEYFSFECCTVMRVCVGAGVKCIFLSWPLRFLCCLVVSDHCGLWALHFADGFYLSTDMQACLWFTISIINRGFRMTNRVFSRESVCFDPCHCSWSALHIWEQRWLPLYCVPMLRGKSASLVWNETTYSATAPVLMTRSFISFQARVNEFKERQEQPMEWGASRAIMNCKKCQLVNLKVSTKWVHRVAFKHMCSSFFLFFFDLLDVML